MWGAATDFFRIQTKGTVLLVCLRCVDTLVLVSKHAEGMSLRCDAVCALAYCGRHESSQIIKAHTDCTDFTWLSLWVENLTEALRWFTPKAHTDSTRFNKKIVCGNLC